MKRKLIIFILVAMLLLSACTPSPESTLEAARSCIGKTTEELLEQIGRPYRVSYSSSCLGDGLDGELYYNAFTVYVYRDTDGTETVYDVMEGEQN